MPRAANSRESAIVWTDEERRYLCRMLSHDFSSPNDEARKAQTARRNKAPDAERKPVGEFAVLVLGARGTGKTSLLTRICKNRMPPAGEPAPRARRTTADVDSSPYTFTLHDIPAANLWRDDLIHQSIAATDAALLLYSISDPASLRIAEGLAELISDAAAASGRPYAVLLAGSKSDLDERRVAYSEGGRVAGRVVAGFGVRASFMEVSALEGRVAGLLPRIGADVLYARGVCEQRRAFEESVRREEEARRRRDVGKRGLWERFSRGFFVRRVAA